METLSIARSFEGTQGVYRHRSDACQCDMTFAVFLPPQAKDGPVPVLWYLSGLTCTHQNVMDKGEYRRAAAEHGVGSSGQAPDFISMRPRRPMPTITAWRAISRRNCRR